MGATNSKYPNEKINNNQLNIPDFLLIRILEFLNDDCRLKQYSNPLQYGLVSTYWIMKIVPKSTKRITTSFSRIRFLETFPITLQKLYSTIAPPHTASTSLPQTEFNVQSLLSLRKLTIINNPKETITTTANSKKDKSKNKKKSIESLDYADSIVRYWKRSFKSLTLVNFEENQFLIGKLQKQDFRLETLRLYPAGQAEHESLLQFHRQYRDIANNVAIHKSTTSWSLSSSFKHPIGDNVESFKISSCDIVEIYDELPKLKKLSIKINRPDETYANLIRHDRLDISSSFVDCIKNLRELKLDYCYSANTAEPVLCRMTQLESLSIIGTYHTILRQDNHVTKDSKMILEELKLMPQLKKLTLRSILTETEYDDDLIPILSNNLTNLQRLSIDRISPDICEYLTTNPSIRHLTIPRDNSDSFKRVLSTNEIIVKLSFKNVYTTANVINLFQSMLLSVAIRKNIKLVKVDLPYVPDDLVLQLANKDIQVEHKREVIHHAETICQVG